MFQILFTSPYGFAFNNIPMETKLLRPLLASEAPKAIEVFVAKQLIFWIDTKSSNIYKMKSDGTEKSAILTDLRSPQKIALDFVSERLYWTDDKVGVIESSDFYGKKRYVLVSGKMSKPFALAVAPPNGLIFWVDVQEPAKIERMGLDGKFFLRNKSTFFLSLSKPVWLTLLKTTMLLPSIF